MSKEFTIVCANCLPEFPKQTSYLAIVGCIKGSKTTFCRTQARGFCNKSNACFLHVTPIKEETTAYVSYCHRCAGKKDDFGDI